MSKTFYSLSYPNYRLWFISNLVSATAVWMQRVCQIWVVLTILTDNSAIAVGFVTAFQFLPQMLLGPFGGVLADWVNRRRLIQVTQICVAIIGLVLGILFVTNSASLYHIYLAALLSGAADALSAAVRNTFLSELVPTSSIPNAISLNSTSFNIARLFGPALAGLLIELIGPGWVFVSNFALFAVPVLALALMKTEHFFPCTKVDRHKGMLREGFTYVRTRSDILAILVMIAVVSGLGLNFQVTQALMATDVFGMGAGSYGLLGSMLAIGSLSGALLSARRRAPRFSHLLVYAMGFGVIAIAASLAPSYTIFALLMVPTGFSMLTFLIAVNTLVQISTPLALRGRVLAIYFAVNLGITPIGSPVVGWIAQEWGARWSIAVGGIGAILVALTLFIWAKSSWDVELHHRRKWPFVDITGPRERHLRDESQSQNSHDDTDDTEKS